ncbi:MAG: DUF504 domain-containing protein [Ignisphaera sp.]|nr:DUF504 domain-containing protein [Ignisphaera sp.]
MRIKDAINKILWTTKEREELEKYQLIITDRVDPMGYKEIPFTNISHVDNNYVYIKNGENITAIPIHRVIKIIKCGEEIYTRKT